MIVRSFYHSAALSGHTPEDVRQQAEVFKLKVVKEYKPGRAKLNTFMYHAVRNDLRNWIRSPEVFSVYHERESGYEMKSNVDLVSLLESTPLSKQEEDVLKLFLQDLTFREIGEKMGYTQQWASKWFESAVSKLKGKCKV